MPFGTQAHGVLYGALHSTTEHYATLQLEVMLSATSLPSSSGLRTPEMLI